MTRRILVLAALTAALAGCGKPAGSGEGAGTPSGGAATGRKPKFAFVTNGVSAFWTVAQKGLEQAKRDFDVDVVYKAPPNGKVEEQQQILEDLLTLGVDGIAISAVDPENMTPVLDKVAAKVPLICHDSDAPKSKRRMYVGTNNVVAGREAGKALLKAMGGKPGKLAVFVGFIDAANAQERKKGIDEAIQGSGITLVDVFTDGHDSAKAKAKVEDVVTAHPEVNCMIGLWSYNPPAIATVLRATGNAGKITVVGFDDEADTLQAVQDGVIAATVVQRQYEFGVQSVKYLKMIHEGKSDDALKAGFLDTGVDIITKENVAEFRKKMDALKK